MKFFGLVKNEAISKKKSIHSRLRKNLTKNQSLWIEHLQGEKALIGDLE